MIAAPTPRRLFLLVLAAALLLQTAWILALPAFGGIDEFAHVYKAEAVAHGQLLHQGSLDTDYGHLVEVPEDVVDAASAVCESYEYTAAENCHPVEDLGGGTVTVATTAGTYNPTYYAVVGLMARPFSGAATDFALRGYTAVLAALLLAWAAVATSAWARNAWPLLALLVAATPVLIYSTTIASPNGVGYAAACLVWAAGIGLVEDSGRPRVVALTAGALTMMATHTTGVMWLAFLVAVIALLQPLSRWRTLFGRSRLLTAAAVIALGGLTCVAWILLAKTNVPHSGDANGRLELGRLAIGQFAWTLQTIAAFPLRDESAPVIVYLLWLVPFVGLMVAGARLAPRRLRLAAVVLLALWVAVPIALSFASYASVGLAWQGRYALPLAVGFTALAGLALHRGDHGPRRFHFVLAVVLCALAQTISCVSVAWREADAGLSPAFAGAVPGGIALIALLAVAGSMLPLLLSRSLSRTAPMPARSTVGVT